MTCKDHPLLGSWGDSYKLPSYSKGGGGMKATTGTRSELGQAEQRSC